ncbi:MAG: hypothetical protein M0T83_03600 [Nitrospiraceae bacterium]|nr:hypothetical protein [Nitrospiraceae bacterium]
MDNDSGGKKPDSGKGDPDSLDFTPRRAKILGIFFRIFTILEFGFLGFIIFDLFRKYVITGNLDWWKK